MLQKINVSIFYIVVIFSTWIIVLPFALIALPYLFISYIFDIEKNGLEEVIMFLILPYTAIKILKEKIC